MSQVRLTFLELQAFRGFGETRRIDLDGDVVLIRGDNGSGKTSIVDGLIWLICGELAHLTDRVKGLRRTEDPVVNRYFGAPARVRLGVALDSDLWEFERTGTASKSVLAAWHNRQTLDQPTVALARAFGDFTEEQLSNALRTWGVLRQDAVRAALESGGALHERLSRVVGLERVTLFASAATKASKDLAAERTRLRRIRQQLVARYEEAQAHLALAQQTEGMAGPPLVERLSQLASTLPVGIRLSSSGAGSRSVAESESASRLLALAEDAAGAFRAHRTSLEAAQDATTAVTEARAELRSAQRRAEAVTRQAPLSAQLASAALELLSDHCPVCGQPVDESSVRVHLQELLAEAKATAAGTEQALANVARAQARLGEAQAAEQRRAESSARLTDAVERLRSHFKAPDALLAVDDEWLSPAQVGTLAEVIEEFAERLRELNMRRVRSTGTVRSRTEVEELRQEVDRAERDLQELEARCERAAALDRAAHSAAERIIERALRRLEPSFAEVFDRMAPHPTFTQLRARQDIFYGRNQIVPEVYDPERRIAANPMLIYSEGQLNVVALSYFLGLALNAREGALPFLVLDDPIQAMDILSVLGFADLCRRVREDHQLLLTMHDRRFADLLSRKLAPREEGTRTILHELDGWTREGPRIRTSESELAEIIPLLKPAAS